MSKGAAAYITVGALLIIVVTILGMSVFLKIMEIEVEGESMYAKGDIISVSGIMSGDNLMFVDTGLATRRIHTAMPFISDVKITRVLPSSIRIEVTESTALATITFRDSVLVIDSTGRVLKQADSAPEGLIEIRGINLADASEGSQLRPELGGEMQLQYMRDILAAIEKEGIQGDVSYLDVTYSATITLGYSERFRVILGGPSQARSKINQLPGIVEGIEAISTTNVKGDIDMSNPSGEWRFNESW